MYHITALRVVKEYTEYPEGAEKSADKKEIPM